MRKYLLIVIILASFQASFSQYDYSKPIRRQIDSLKRVLPNLRGTDKVDGLNELVSKYLDRSLGSWQAESDSARPFAVQAIKEAKSIGYKKGLGHSYLNMEIIDCNMFGTYAQQQKRFDSGYFNSVQQNAKNSILIGEELKDNNMIAEANYVLNWLLLETKNTPTPIFKTDYIKNAITYFEKANNKNRLIRSYADYSYLAAQINDFDVAINCLEKAIQLSSEAGNKDNIAHYYRNLLRINISTGDFENGLEHSKKYVQLAETLPKDNKGYNTEYANSLFIMSTLYKTAGDYETTKDLLNKAFKYYPPEDLDGLDFGIAILGDVYRLTGNKDSALYYLGPLAKKTNWGAILGLVGLSNLYIDLKEYDKALPIIDTYKSLGKKVNDVGSEGIALTLAASAYLGKKDYKTALKNASEGLPILKDAKRKVIIIQNYELHSRIFHALGRNDSAYFYLTQYMSLKDSLLNRQFLWRLNSYKKQAEEERKTSQINLLNKDNQIKEQKLKQQGTVRNSLIAGIILLFLLGIFISRSLYLKRKKQQAENERKQTELEMQALRAQMNPHFIFNCLSSINKYILKNEPDTASDYLTRFSRLIRMVLLNSQRSLITLEDELDMLTIYLDMERMRFKNAFNYNIIFANRVDADAIFIPPLLLQPFCENAIWHGLKPLSDHQQGDHEPGRLDIILSMEGKVLNCSITDNGIGRKKALEIKSKSAEEKKSLGLKITTERLALLNQEKNAFTSYEIEDLKDENGNAAGTTVKLRISLSEPVEEYVFSPIGTNGG